MDFQRSSAADPFQLKNPLGESHEGFPNVFHSKYFKHWRAGLPHFVEVSKDAPLPTIFAVGGGKGGVGKSVISSNLSAKLARSGKRVLAIDLDLGGSNLHTYFGKRVHSPSLTDFLADSSLSFQSIMSETSVNGLSLITTGQMQGLSALAKQSDYERLWQGIMGAKALYGYDAVVLDLGAGTASHTVDFFLAAHVGIVTVLAEPTSIENAYTFLKAVLWKLIENAGVLVGNEQAACEILRRLVANESKGAKLGYYKKLLASKDEFGTLVNCILGAIMGRKIGFTVNQIRSQKDIEIATSMAGICRDYFGWKTVPLGFLNYDEAAWKSLRSKRLLVEVFPHSLLSKRLDVFLSELLRSIAK